MFTQLDHVCYAVRDLDEAVGLYSRTFGVDTWERIAMPERHMDIAVAHVGDTLLELIAATSDEAAFAKFLAERGPGMHHVAYRVPDIVAALTELRARGVPLIDETPRVGLHGTQVAFIHPKGTLGVLTELVQH